MSGIGGTYLKLSSVICHSNPVCRTYGRNCKYIYSSFQTGTDEIVITYIRKRQHVYTSFQTRPYEIANTSLHVALQKCSNPDKWMKHIDAESQCFNLSTFPLDLGRFTLEESFNLSARPWSLHA